MSAEGAANRIAAHPEVGGRFAEIVVAYAVTGKVSDASHHLLPPAHTNFAALLRDALEYFVLGHEYAHVLLGHLDRAARRKGVLPVAEAEAIAYSWQDEFEADHLGALLSIYAGGDHDQLGLSDSFSGISLFFDGLDVMDRAIALLETGDEDARQIGSHPPAPMRVQGVADLLIQQIGAHPANAALARQAVDTAQVQREIVRLLWRHTRPLLLELHRQGVRPARSWRTVPKEGR